MNKYKKFYLIFTILTLEIPSYTDIIVFIYFQVEVAHRNKMWQHLHLLRNQLNAGLALFEAFGEQKCIEKLRITRLCLLIKNRLRK